VQSGNWPIGIIQSHSPQVSEISLQSATELYVAGPPSTAQRLTTTAPNYMTLAVGAAKAEGTGTAMGATAQPLTLATLGTVTAPGWAYTLHPSVTVSATALSTAEPRVTTPTITSSCTVAVATALSDVAPVAPITAAAAEQTSSSSAASMPTVGAASTSIAGTDATVVTPASGPETSISTWEATVPDEKPPQPPTSSTSAAVVATSAATVTTLSPAASAVVVRQHQSMRLYNGSTNWRLYRGIFRRLSKVNEWVTDDEQLQHLMLSL